MSIINSAKAWLFAIFLLIALWVIILSPSIFVAVTYYLMGPEGFWQNFVFLGLGLYFFGFIQIILIAVGIALTISFFGEVFR